MIFRYKTELSMHTVHRRKLWMSQVIRTLSGKLWQSFVILPYLIPSCAHLAKTPPDTLTTRQSKSTAELPTNHSLHMFVLVCSNLWLFLVFSSSPTRPSVTCDHQRAPRLLAAGRERAREGEIEGENSRCSLHPSSSSSSIRLLLPVAAPPTCRY